MLILQGSHRSNGSTAAACLELQKKVGGKVAHLCDLEIAHFSYGGATSDDFEALILEIVSSKVLVLATPIYWYTMSGMMKVFLDRISDLLKWNKDLGRRLRGIKMYVISVSGQDDAPEHFNDPFRRTADYLGMEFGSYVHICPGEEARIEKYADLIH